MFFCCFSSMIFYVHLGLQMGLQKKWSDKND